MRFSAVSLISLLASLVSAKVYFEERFAHAHTLEKNWKAPKAPLKNKDGEEYPLGEWAVEEGTLKTTKDSRYYELTSMLAEPFSNQGQTLVVQLSVRHPQNIDCGGGYVKLLGKNIDQETFSGETPYLLMFGPDICGTDRKVHVILTQNGTNYLIKKAIPAPADTVTHIYTFILNPDQTYQVLLDQEKVAFGTLEEDWDIIPPRRIKDPQAVKPADWDDRKEIEDAEDKKPDDWDSEPEFLISKDGKPADWDDEMDGDWVPPKKRNPAFKGEWKPRKIANPAYQGTWSAPLIDNPDYAPNDKAYVLGEIGAVGFDLWQVKSGSLFDNILITDSEEYAKKVAEKLWRPLYELEKEEAVQEERRLKEKAERDMEEEKKRFEEQKQEALEKLQADKAEQPADKVKILNDSDGDDEEEKADPPTMPKEDPVAKKKDEL